MNAHEKAVSDVIDERLRRRGVMDVRTTVELYLAALPPSIVVDGRMVVVSELDHGFESGRCRFFYDGCNCSDVMQELIDDFREVAGD